jgi:hypothetical protein
LVIRSAIGLLHRSFETNTLRKTVFYPLAYGQPKTLIGVNPAFTMPTIDLTDDEHARVGNGGQNRKPQSMCAGSPTVTEAWDR